MMTAWAHLSNAAHIDRIIADVQARPEAWAAARDAARAAERLAALDAAWALSAPAVMIPALDAAGDAARAAARDAAWHAASDAASDAAWHAADDAASDAAWHAADDAAWLAVAALVAWDDCGHLLDADAEHVRILALLGHTPAVLLLPAVTALNKSMTYSV